MRYNNIDPFFHLPSVISNESVQFVHAQKTLSVPANIDLLAKVTIHVLQRHEFWDTKKSWVWEEEDEFFFWSNW